MSIEPVFIPGEKLMAIDNYHNYESLKPVQNTHKCIHIMATTDLLLKLEIEPSIVKKLRKKQICYSLIVGSTAIPLPGAALPQGYYKVVMR